jgi:catechol 2,3-dioxygenase-like lactoylglutathione lyase family enzyme
VRNAGVETPWPAHLRPGALRWVRSSAHYDATVHFYRDLVGLPVVGGFSDSFGEDGTIFGLPDTGTQLEIVRAQHAARPADRFDQVVFYLDHAEAVRRAVEPLLRAGLTPVPDPHPYWRDRGAVIVLDPDGRGVVYAPWVYGRDPEPGAPDPVG